MKTKLLIIAGIAVFVGTIVLSSFSIQKDDESYVLFCNHWIFSDYKTCKPLWNESERDTPAMKFSLSEESWDNLLLLPDKKARKELQKTFDEHAKFFMDVTITGLKDSYVVGEKPTFTVVEAGYGIPCTYPQITVSKNGQDKPHWEYRLVYSCPFFRDGFPILSYMSVPHNNRMMPPITEPGQYTITASSSYDSSVSKQFTVHESDFIYDYTVSYFKHGNSTGNTSLIVDLNNGNYTLKHNSQLTQNKLSDEELNELKKLIDDNDLLRGYSSVSHDTDPACSTCISYEMNISLGDYTHFVQWQNDKDRLSENHVPVVKMLEALTDNLSENPPDLHLF